MCHYHRGTSLLSIAGKILARVLLNRLQHHIAFYFLVSVWLQAMSRFGRHVLRYPPTSGKMQKGKIKSLYLIFINLTEAFDNDSHEGLMSKFSCPDQFITMVRQFYDDFQARIQGNRDYSKPLPVSNGVNQD